ncbi:MAG: AraC family transcriptional regulator [Candidatus Cohnella colombiensis]|uniref:AraC family transcriptional regulator n=1 Tax=Candidatus Cohnella colombiensis TaxID=3121368 RepID=A0AA95EY16_9BACL|nr:MAG: AraC family transcriptional regulator [Cohnella sp.]
MDTSISGDSWILPIQVSVRRWHIPLTDRERNLLEYALCNAADELIRYTLAGATVRIRHGVAVVLFDLLEQNQIVTGLEHRCRQLRKFAKTYLYVDVDISIGDTVPMHELSQQIAGSVEEDVADAQVSTPSDLHLFSRVRQARHSEDGVIHQILNYVEEHLLDELTREDIAQYVHFHPAYLSRFFRKKTGWSLTEYIVQKRIEYAKEMLAQPNLKIGYIMNHLGYYNLSHFTRTFKKTTGYTPQQYRKRNQ